MSGGSARQPLLRFGGAAQHKMLRLQFAPLRGLSGVVVHGGVVDQQLFLPLPAGVRHGNGGQQAAGVGVDGVGRQLFGPGQLHDAALVNHGDAVGDVAHHGQVVGDEQIGDAAFFL